MSTSTTSSTITRPNPRADDDPLHSWMRIVPKSIPESKRSGDIAAELREREFDPSQSRAIIFTVSRNDTEDLARKLNREATSEDPWKGRVRWFHAGMTADERSATYESFRAEEETAVLCATKAFGMGMDIPNIHYVFHYQPPYSLEDYIQQIGRAGRDGTAREEAGFGRERPIRCVLYAETEDFDTLHGRLKASRLSWGQVARIQDVLHEYAARLDHHQPDPDSAIPVPTDLVSRHEAFEDVYNASTMQKTGFHWLERLERIRQEYYVPAHLELANEDPETDRATSEDLKKLCRHVEAVRRNAESDKDRILVNTGSLFNVLDINTSAALFEHLREAQEAGHIRVFRTLSVQCTKNHASVIRESTEKRDRLPPRLVLAFQLAESIVAGLSHDRFFQLDPEWFTDEAREMGGQVLSPSKWEWLDDEESRQEYRAEVIEDLQQGSRARAILFLVRSGPDVKFRSTLEGEGEVFEMRIESRGGERQQEQYLGRIRNLTRRLLALVYEKNADGTRIDLMSTLEELDLEGERDINEFEQTLLFLKRIGFLKMNGGLLPMAVETYLQSKEPIDASDQESDDFAVREEFQQAGRLKELRLFALRVLASLEEETRQNAFIKQYLRSEGPGEVLSLLDETLNDTEADPSLLSALREEALQEEVDRLSEDQEAVYESPLNQSTLVSAGPGSGKTHTLLLRLARLIHEENVSPGKILVLAYNRAVVTEVKSRLRQLLETLGYRDLSRRLRVFTFHGLIRYVLGDEVDPDDLGEGKGDPWADTFIDYIENRPGRIGMQLSPETIQYIFVDEFQDITEERYKILRWIAGDSSNVTAIGDPDQSIYGYERAANGQARSALPFFERFEKDFEAEKYRITDNFRSLPDIVERADDFIQLNDRRAPRPPLEPQRTCPDEWAHAGQYVERNDHERRAPWLYRLKDLLNQVRPQGKRPRDVAVLFRSNAEVYRGYRLVHEHLGDYLAEEGIPLVVQGATRNWLRVREIAYCLDQLNLKIEREGEDATFLPDESVWDWLVASNGGDFPNAWDDYTLRLIRCVVERFEMEQTDEFEVIDLVDHIEDTFRRDKGQIYKLLQIHEAEAWESEERTPNLVLSNLHKVKGLEYDVVVMPASFQPLPFSNGDGGSSDLNERIEEERRAYFVGMTRARNQLIRYEWARERHLRAGERFKLKREVQNSLGVSLEADAFAGHVKISKCADEKFLYREGGFRNGKEYLRYMRERVEPGDPLTLTRERGSWYVQHDGHRIAELASKASRKLESRTDSNTGLAVEGVTVSDVVRYTYEDSLEYDRENGTDYTDYWSEVFEDVGYTYLVNFAGFAQID